MNQDIRTRLQTARTSQYGDIMRTTLFGLIAIAAIDGFGATGVALPLVVAVIAIALFGILGGGAALDDLTNLREDMDEVTAASTYGRGAKARDIGMLKMLSAGLIALTAVAEIIAILW